MKRHPMCVARPVIGICTALERAKWSVWDQEAFLNPPGSFDNADHDVRLEPGSLAARAAGEELHSTKSHHHQGIDRLGDGLRITGWATIDELPEAIEAPDRRFGLGVQWHPEADELSRVIESFVREAAAARSATP